MSNDVMILHLSNIEFLTSSEEDKSHAANLIKLSRVSA